MLRIDVNTMPAALQEIYNPVSRNWWLSTTLDELRPTWGAHVAQARTIPGVHIEDDGATLYLRALSPGCQACKAGTWDCIFVTMQCNLNCDFCYSSHAIPKNYTGSAFGTVLEQIAENYARTHISGISFSGGEPFLESQKLLDWVAWFKSRFPQYYYWVYTNGLLASEHLLRQLGDLGLDEIRFDMAATGYTHPTVMQNLRASARYIPCVTVEIPAIPRDTARLLGALVPWVEAGVRFLNLHELMYEPGTNAALMPGRRVSVMTEDGHVTAIAPDSRRLTLRVIRQVQELALPLAVNDCSLQSKLLQLRGRRRCIAPLLLAPYEKLIAGYLYESGCAYKEGGEMQFFHPDALTEAKQAYPGYHFIRLARLAPLSLDDFGQWVVFEEFR